jgi:F-type H+-transporting ATPase subunit c
MLGHTLIAGALSLSDSGLKSLAIGIAAGLGAVGAGVGIGLVFKGVIEAVARQPELREEITSIQWLAFALTEACFFYGLVGGLLAYAL